LEWNVFAAPLILCGLILPPPGKALHGGAVFFYRCMIATIEEIGSHAWKFLIVST